MSSPASARSPASAAWWIASSAKPAWLYQALARRCRIGVSPARMRPARAGAAPEQMVVAVPRTLVVEREQEEVGLFQLAEEAGRALGCR